MRSKGFFFLILALGHIGCRQFSLTIERDDLEMALFDGQGGLGQMYALFGDGMEAIISEMNEALSP